MSKFLFATFPVTGHVNPGLPIAQELVKRGHDVRWYSTTRFRRSIESIGARYVPYRRAMKIDETTFAEMPGRPNAGGLHQMKWDIKSIFVEIMRGQFRDLEEELMREPADVIVGDNAALVTQAISERFGMKWATYGMSVLTSTSRDTAPFGHALLPSSSFFGRLRNKALYAINESIVFREAAGHFHAIRRELGLRPVKGPVFDFVNEADVYLHSGAPSFEYPRTDMPANIRFIGATVPQPSPSWSEPEWWGDMNGRRRVVLVTQGTIATDFDQLIHPAIRALAKMNVLVVVTTGSRPAEELLINPLPANARVERFIPYAHLMPKVDLLLTNGGYGSIQIALKHGVPVVAIGNTEEKPEIANRVQWSGVGLGLKVNVATEDEIRGAVTKVLSDSSYRKRAKDMQKELAGLDAPRSAADLLEELIGTAPLAQSA